MRPIGYTGNSRPLKVGLEPAIGDGSRRDFQMPLPQRINFVTLGAHSVSRLRGFSRSWGWAENDGASDT
jgi:hypothetical protein